MTGSNVNNSHFWLGKFLICWNIMFQEIVSLKAYTDTSQCLALDSSILTEI